MFNSWHHFIHLKKNKIFGSYSQGRMKAAAWILWGSFLSSLVQPVYELQRKQTYQFSQQGKWRRDITGKTETYCFEPKILQRDHEGCLRSWKRRISWNELHYICCIITYHYVNLSDITISSTVMYLPHIEVLLLFGLKKEAFVAVFDFTYLQLREYTMNWCCESDTRLNTTCGNN